MGDPGYDTSHQPYPQVAPQPDLPALEQSILAFWQSDGTFAASVAARQGGANEYVFYDGPPFANGLPHYGHLLTGFVKDAVPRFQTMRGRRVERRFGWDCHGLPAEMAAEKELGVAGRAAVESLGVDRFNDHCKGLAMRTKEDWRRYVGRQARWVDFDNDYKTMDRPYMESVLWAFRTLWEKGLIYEGFRVLPYCWECETPLSNFETRIDDAYRPRTDPSVTVAFDLAPLEPTGAGDDLAEALAGPLRLLAWTTTPWTLPSNLAVAVGPDIDYALVRTASGVTVAAKSWWDSRLGGEEDLDKSPSVGDGGVLGPKADRELLGVVKGSALIGRRYAPMFNYFADTEGAFVVLGGDFVSTEDGTGVVHMAPGFGEDDHAACTEAGIPLVVPVDDRGRFTSAVADYEGLGIFEANEAIIADLSARGAVVESAPYEHSYPHCWRTDTPLIYRAMSSWFVDVTAIKPRMIELNQEINWVPAHVRDGAFGKGLESAPDWSISRNRFWGAPIPVWKSDNPAYPRVDVYGSLEEIERDFGVVPEDLHRPAIDNLVRPNPDDPTGTSMMRRTPEVLDCWFESGSMPFAQLHYPFENRERFEQHYPADFIVEYLGQTRGWFYTLHVLATALFDKPPFRNCVAHGVVLGHDGRKMSKHLGNYPDPEDVFARYGADALRWFLLSSAVLRGQDLIVDGPSIADATRQAILPLWNTWNFFSLYANADRIRARFRTDAQGVLDRWLMAEVAAMVSEVEISMEAADLASAAASIARFLEGLTNWYVRRSRERFWGPVIDGSPDQDKVDAYDTLATALTLTCQVAAPLLPMVTEEVWKGLTSGRSVHLTDWPDASSLPADDDLRRAMGRVRAVCSVGHSIRKAAGLRTRLPLAHLTVSAPWAEELRPYASMIAEEVNVREVRLETSLAEVAEETLAVEPSVLGPRLGAKTQAVIGAVRRGEWSKDARGNIEAAGVVLEPGEYRLALRSKDERSARALATSDAIVAIDLEPGPELVAEGIARDAIRAIQESRRAAGLEITDRITCSLAVPEEAKEAGAALETHRELICSQVLADHLDVAYAPSDPSEDGQAWRHHRLAGGIDVWVSVKRTN